MLNITVFNVCLYHDERRPSGRDASKIFHCRPFNLMRTRCASGFASVRDAFKSKNGAKQRKCIDNNMLRTQLAKKLSAFVKWFDMVLATTCHLEVRCVN